MCLRRRITVRCRHDGPDEPRPELKRLKLGSAITSVDNLFLDIIGEIKASIQEEGYVNKCQLSADEVTS